MQRKAKKNPISTHTCPPSPRRILEQISRFYIHSITESSLSNGLKSLTFSDIIRSCPRTKFIMSASPTEEGTLVCVGEMLRMHIRE